MTYQVCSSLFSKEHGVFGALHTSKTNRTPSVSARYPLHGSFLIGSSLSKQHTNFFSTRERPLISSTAEPLEAMAVIVPLLVTFLIIGSND